MVQKEILLKEINKNNGIISTKEVLEFGIHKDVLKELECTQNLGQII